MADDEQGGVWRTIDGAHVFIKNGVIEKGPAHLVGKKPDGEASPRLAVLKESLRKKERLFDQKLGEHLDDVKSANGQPLNDKSNGASTTRRWDRQSDSMRAIKQDIEKTKQAIVREEGKIANVHGSDTPDFLHEMIASGELSQWRKHPNTFFVKGVDKGRIVWDSESRTLSHRYLSEVPKEQYAAFRDAFNKANAANKAASATKTIAPDFAGRIQTSKQLDFAGREVGNLTGTQHGLFGDTSKPKEPPRPIGSKNANDPKHTGMLFSASGSGREILTMAADSTGGHWVTIDGHPVYIGGSAGYVPRRLKADAGATRFTKSHLQNHLIAHHEQVGGGTQGVSAHESQQFERSGRGMGQTTFHKQLPGEVKTYLEGNPNARRLFRVTDNANDAGGADSMADLGEDKYFAHIDKASGSKLGQALETAHASNDPEVKFLAHVHDNLPGGKTNFESLKAGGLRVGDEFQVNGEKFRVAEDSDGLRVLQNHEYGEVPVDALSHVPADQGTFRPGKRQREIIPFSRIYAMSATDGEAVPHLSLGSNLPRTRNGLPCHYFWRDSARDGNWFNARHGYTMSVTPDVRQKWEQNFRRMKAAGDEPPVVKDHHEDADSTLGYVVDVKNDADTYRELHQYLGDDAKATALRNKISIGLDPDYIDSRKQHYGPTIVHSAVTNRPAMPGETDAVRMVASRSGGEVEIIQLSKAYPTNNTPDPIPAGAGASPTPAGNNRSSMHNLKYSPETMDALHKHVPGLSDANDDDKLASVAQHLKTMSDADCADAGDGTQTMSVADIHAKALENRTAWKTAADELETVKTSLTEKENTIQQMSRTNTVTPPDPLAMRLMSRSLDTELDAAITGGALDAATAKAVKGLLVQNGKPTVLAMSRASDNEDPLAFQLLSVLKANKPKFMGGQTGSQTMTMSRADPDAPAGEDPEVKAALARMQATANQGNK